MARPILTETQVVETIYAAASALLLAAEKLDAIPFGQRHELDALLDQPAYPADFSSLAKSMESIADEWQGEIDTADEADDRRRANPLEPDNRRLA